MCIKDVERIKKQDKVLAIITNQYMFEQLVWYHSQYPEGIWEAIVIRFGKNADLMKIMYKKCVECGIFSKIVCYDCWLPECSLQKKFFVMCQYICQYVTGRREKGDKKLIEKILGEKCQYEKVIVQSMNSIIATAALNAMSDKVLVCLEDGLGDYLPVKGIRNYKETLDFLLAKMNVMNKVNAEHQFRLKNDCKLIKYCSLPLKMQYTGYRIIKPLFERREENKFSYASRDFLMGSKEYDMVIFSTAFLDFDKSEEVYDVLHTWLSVNYGSKKIFIKPHPREVYNFDWEDLDICVGGDELSGEAVVDLIPNAEILFLFTSTILLKVCREKKDFKIVRFKNIASKEYELTLEKCADLLGLSNDDWIILGDTEVSSI